MRIDDIPDLYWYHMQVCGDVSTPTSEGIGRCCPDRVAYCSPSPLSVEVVTVRGANPDGHTVHQGGDPVPCRPKSWTANCLWMLAADLPPDITAGPIGQGRSQTRQAERLRYKTVGTSALRIYPGPCPEARHSSRDPGREVLTPPLDWRQCHSRHISDTSLPRAQDSSQTTTPPAVLHKSGKS
jgi:hypothetical protein